MKGLTVLVMVLALAVSAYGTPAGSGGGTSSSSDDTNLEGWFALGAAALVAGLLIWDIVSDSRQEQAVASEASSSIQETGIDWETLQGVPLNDLVIGVSVFPARNGWALAQYFQQLLLPLEDEGFAFGGDPVNLGSLSPSEQAAMAGDFLEYSWFIAAEDHSILLFTGGAAPVWSAPVASWDSVSIRNAALDLMVRAPSLR